MNTHDDFCPDRAPMVSEVFVPRGLAPSALDAIIKGLDTLNRRQIRMETRLVRLMKDHGLDSAGNPTDTH